MILVIFLIFFFTALIIYQLFNNNIIEGLTTKNAVREDNYQDYAEDPMILAKQNAGNIQVLREQLNGLMGLDTKVKQLQEQVNGMRDAQVAAMVEEIPAMDNAETDVMEQDNMDE
jgi:hypothetical protein